MEHRKKSYEALHGNIDFVDQFHCYMKAPIVLTSLSQSKKYRSLFHPTKEVIDLCLHKDHVSFIIYHNSLCCYSLNMDMFKSMFFLS